MRKLNYFFLVVCLILNFSQSQSQDSVKTEKTRRNVIKLNLTSGLIYKTAFLFEYERVLDKHHTFSIQAGFISLDFSNLLKFDSAIRRSEAKNSGFSLSADYRFYLPKENKDDAPHGIYLAPYMSYAYLHNERIIPVANTPDGVLLKSDINVLGAGLELGYQFLLGKKWTLDLILIGPSLANYNVTMQLIGNIDPSQIDPKLQEILQSVANRFPLVGDLLKNDITHFKGSTDTLSAGFRYS